MARPDKTNDTITIVCAADENYVAGLAVTLLSALRRCSAATIEIVVIDAGLKPSGKTRIEQMVARLEKTRPASLPIRWVALGDALDGMRELRHFSKAIYVRLLLAELIGDRDECIYLDCDLLIQDDLAKIWQLDLGDNLLAAVAGRAGPVVTEYMTGFLHGSAAPLSYFNSGVLLINLRRFRETGLAKTTIEFCQKHADVLRFPDQDALNVHCAGQWLQLPAKWNQVLKANRSFPEIDSGILHFVGEKKPWTIHFRTDSQPLRLAHAAYMNCLFQTGILPMHRRFFMQSYRKFLLSRAPA